MTIPSDPFRLALLVLQPSPFCNINCDYCYLPHRTSTKRMPMEVMARTVEQVYESGLVEEVLSLVWHAGEPLAVPISYYEEAFETIRRHAPAGARIRHSMQSNGMLINDAWCDFLQRENVSIGLSLDGPEELHDRHRKTRSGRGTHAAALRGLKLLQARGIPFHVICVLTAESLDQADAIYRFFLDLGVTRLGFNVEEQEGEHLGASICSDGSHEAKVRAFFERIFVLQREDKARMVIREFDQAAAKITGMPSMRNMEFPVYNEQIRPFGILNVDCDGNFSTYSPELLGMEAGRHGKFEFGNILQTKFTEAAASPKFIEVLEEIKSGIETCRRECPYYGWCGGGSPGNKFYENGTFASGATRFCRYSIQLPLELALKDIESSLHLRPAGV